ncbi:MAG: aldo/keto reductase [Fibrobacter sp.]|nr:aldo/keto reductase [Fibrobacter sp.]
MKQNESEEQLQSTRIGSVPKKSSVLGLGCWAIGGRDWGIQNENDSLDAIKASYDRGITHFDTAQAYGKGHSEELLGRALKAVREKVFIASKMMFTQREKVEASIANSLKRLKTDYIDLFYIHWPKKNADLEGMMEGLIRAREKGLIKGIGVSNFSIEQMETLLRVGQIDAHQLCYNLLWRWPEYDIIPFCIEKKISIVTYSSIAQGILTGKFAKEIEFAAGDHRKYTVLFDKELWPLVYEGVENLKNIAENSGRSLLELAIRWVLSRQGVSTVLVGARNGSQVQSNVKSLHGEIDSTILDELTRVSNLIMKSIPDTGNIFRWYP